MTDSDALSPTPDASGSDPAGTASLGPSHRAAYATLVQHDSTSAEDLAVESGTTPTRMKAILEDLQRLTLAKQSADGWSAVPVQDDMDAKLAEQEIALHQLREHHRHLSAFQKLYNAGRHADGYDGIEVVRSRHEHLELTRAFQAETRHTVRALDRPPHYTISEPELIAAQQKRQKARLTSGIEFRVIYEPSMWDSPVHAESTLQAIEAGEKARMFPSLPMKMYIFDEDRAIIPLDPARHADSSSLVVHPSGLLRALVDIFEIIWGLSAPITGPGSVSAHDDLAERERMVLTMLAAGASDSRIMHQLDISRSTVTRTITELCSRVHVETRFQLAAEAVRRGWL